VRGQERSAEVGRRERLGDFTTDRRVVVLAGMAAIIGVAAALVATGLLRLIDLITQLSFHGRFSFSPATPLGHQLGAGVVAVPVVGALVIGLMARYGSEKIRGHGIPEALEAILIGRSRIDAKVAVLKPLAVSIGTGGPFGAEGPIIMTGGAFGSLFAQLFHLSDAERKTLLVAGAAAGMAATFGTPVAAVLLAVELLLFEWKPRSLIPVALAAGVAAGLRPVLMDGGALFPVDPTQTLSGEGLPFAVLVGVAAGLASSLLTLLVYGCEDLFGRLRIHWMWWPAAGGVVIGLGGLIEPRALGVGYDNIGSLLAEGRLSTALALLLIVKAVIWAVSLGSGTSGGVLAPLLIMGGTLGALEANLIPVGTPAVWAMVGMAAMVGGTMRAPLTATVFTLELTRDVDALLPLLLACTAAFAVTVLLMRRSILTEKVARRGHHVSRETAIDPFELLRVADVMTTSVETLPAAMQVREAVAFLSTTSATAEPGRRHHGYPVVDEDGAVVGIVTRGDVLAWALDPPSGRLADVVATPVVTGVPNEPLGRLADRMALAAVGRAPIVDSDGRLAGLVSRRDLLRGRVLFRVGELERQRLLRPPLPRRRGPARSRVKEELSPGKERTSW
jgi:CIC family chloride channel protein